MDLYESRSPQDTYRDSRERSLSPGQRGRSPPQEDPTNNGSNLFVTGLAPTVRETDLEHLFSKYGHVDRCQIMKDPHTGDSRGFGFINFAVPEDAEAALVLDGSELQGRKLIVQKAKRKRARTPTPGQYRGPIKERRDRYSDRYDPRGFGGYRERGYDRGYDRYDDRRSYERYPPRDRYDDRPRDRYDDRPHYDRDPRERYPPRDMDRPAYDRGGYDSRDRSSGFPPQQPARY